MACSKSILNKIFIIYGLGISNKSVIKYFNENHIKYIIYNEEEHLELNENYIVIKSPGINNDDDLLMDCLDRNIAVITDIELFYLLRKDMKIIGITGTVGKTTCTTLLYNILKNRYNVAVAGNIGVPIFEYINCSLDYLIVELSSFQLEFIFKFKPYVFIVLNIHPHHLNHHKSFSNYIESKLRPTVNLDSDSYLLINENLIPNFSNRKLNCCINTFSSSLNEVGDCITSKINIGNVNAVSKTARYLEIEDSIIINEINKFKCLEHRFEEINYEDNILIINDSKSTSFISLKDAVEKILKYNYDRKILILGGKIDKLEIDENIDFIKSLSMFEIYLYGENKELLYSLIKNIRIMTKTLEEIIKSIDIRANMLILFSPGAQSLDQYSSYIERGNKFKELINKKLTKY